MGKALAEAACELGHDVVVVSGPVERQLSRQLELIEVISTEEMLDACRKAFVNCDGLIGAAAPCDYRPIAVAEHKISKTGAPLELRLVETSDIVSTLAHHKQPQQWVVGFALETDDHRYRALAKLEKKSCDLMVLNGPEAMNSPYNQVEILDRSGMRSKRSAAQKKLSPAESCEQSRRTDSRVVGREVPQERRKVAVALLRHGGARIAFHWNHAD